MFFFLRNPSKFQCITPWKCNIRPVNYFTLNLNETLVPINQNFQKLTELDHYYFECKKGVLKKVTSLFSWFPIFFLIIFINRMTPCDIDQEGKFISIFLLLLFIIIEKAFTLLLLFFNSINVFIWITMYTFKCNIFNLS